MLEIIETIKKHGALGCTVVALIWMNSRLTSVEDKLFNCLSDKQELRQSYSHQSKQIVNKKLYAVLTCRTKKRNAKKIS